MPLHRYLLVRGVAGVLVLHPESTGATGHDRRHLGHARRAELAPDPDHLADHYEPREEVVRASHQVDRAILDGELEKLGECQARSHELASKKLTSPAAAAAPQRARVTAPKES